MQAASQKNLMMLAASFPALQKAQDRGTQQFDPAVYPNQFVAFASIDGGMTFTDRTVLDTYTGESIDGAYCWPLLTGDGQVFVVYYADSFNLRQPDIKSLVLQFRRDD